MLIQELDCEGLVVFKDESITLCHATYQKDLRKISLQCVSVKGKQIIEKWGSKFEIKNANPSDNMELNCQTDEALARMIDDQGREHAMLKKKIVELEATLRPQALFVESLSIVHLIEEYLGHAQKIDKVTSMLSGIRLFVTEGMKSCLDLISESFQILENVHRMGTQIKSLKILWNLTCSMIKISSSIPQKGSQEETILMILS